MPNSDLASRRSRRFILWVCIAALGMRLLILFAASTYRVANDDTDHFGFGWEMGRVARSLALGQGFSSPLPSPTGPTAMVGPAYPLVLAAIFRALGIYSEASSIAARILQSLFSSGTCIFVYLCGRDTVGVRAGRLAAVVWAIFPLNIFFSVSRVWETTLTALLTSALFWYMLSTRNSSSVSRWLKLGLALGGAALVSTSLVVIVIPFGLSAIWKNGYRAVVPALCGALACVAMVSPWMIRNHAVFGKFILRSNFPLEFRIGNNEQSYGQKNERLHPSNNSILNDHYREVGEMHFMEEDREANALFLQDHRSRFAYSTLNRILNYWTGAWINPIPGFSNQWSVILSTSVLSLLGLLGLYKMFQTRNPAASMYAGCLLVYPIVYYITTTQPRFYHAVTPLLVVVGMYWVSDRWEKTASQFRGDHRVGASGAQDAAKVVIA